MRKQKSAGKNLSALIRWIAI